MKPTTCGLCERYLDGYCIPIKEKYGWTPVNPDKAPWDGCIYDDSQCSCGHPIVDGWCTNDDCDKKRETEESKQ